MAWPAEDVSMSKNNIWYLAGPFHQYQEDVKALAKEHGLVIVDANAAANRKGEAKDVPEVTIRPELKAVTLVVETGGLSQDVAEQLTAELATIGVIVESFAEQSLDRPEGELGETADRLFEVLAAYSEGVLSLQQDRDSKSEQVKTLISENTFLLHAKDELESQLAALKSGAAGDEESALKARLDAAGVTYRANASKESLQKLVEELAKK